MTRCDHIGCRAEQTHRIELRIWPKGSPKIDVAASLSVELSLWLCAQHAAIARAADIMGEELWATVEKIIVDENLPPPDRDTVDVVAIPYRLN